mmetsp:Transcript_465/g.1520  ORF Transcript_465/g.1520 Transcript_465/m.1520 type:complete len:263 (+) Transcript_465:271-1059(+)
MDFACAFGIRSGWEFKVSFESTSHMQMSPTASPRTTYRSSGVNAARKTTFWSLLKPEKVCNTSPVVLSMSATVFGSVASTNLSSALFSTAVTGCWPNKVSTRNSPLRISNVLTVPSIEHAVTSFVFPPPLPPLRVKSIAASLNWDPTVSIASCCLFDRKSQNFTHRSNPQDTITLSSFEAPSKNFTQFTPNASCPINLRTVCPVFTSQTNTPLSPPTEASFELSRELDASRTSLACAPSYVFRHKSVFGLTRNSARFLHTTA